MECHCGLEATYETSWIIPTGIHWPDGHVGGLGPDWWDPRNHGEYTLYLYPSAMGLMTDTLLLTHYMTGEAKYLTPIRASIDLPLRPKTAVKRNCHKLMNLWWKAGERVFLSICPRAGSVSYTFAPSIFSAAGSSGQLLCCRAGAA